MITKYPYDLDLKNAIDLIQERVSEAVQVVNRSVVAVKCIVSIEIRGSSKMSRSYRSQCSVVSGDQ